MKIGVDAGIRERRKYPRRTLFRAITLSEGGLEVARGRTLNISRRGAYFISSAGEELDVSRRFRAEIGVPRHTEGIFTLVPVVARATVCRREKLNGEWGVALYFQLEVDVGF